MSIIRLVRFKPERWSIGVDSTAGDVNFASNAPRPSELHSQRPFFRLKSGSAGLNTTVPFGHSPNGPTDNSAFP